MNLLLDTHTLLWFATDAPQLGARNRALLEHPGSVLVVSIGSFWEMAIKRSLGKLDADLDALAARCEARDMAILHITLAHAKRVADLPLHHRDPFDRMLIAQSLEESLDIVSVDPRLDAYGVRRIWQ